MTKLFSIALLVFSGYIVSIYSLSVPDIDNNNISFNDYRGKKILIVNTATGNAQANQQLAQLQQLYQQYQDSLVIIAFPSNSFGNEPGTNAQIKSVMQGTYNVTFPIAAKSLVKGDSLNRVYQWLGDKMQNDVMDGKTKRDFQKYLIDRSGYIVAKFDSSVSPLSSTVLNAINNY
jgi:glutathione peroxidase